jgi:hypothetical protein
MSEQLPLPHVLHAMERVRFTRGHRRKYADLINKHGDVWLHDFEEKAFFMTEPPFKPLTRLHSLDGTTTIIVPREHWGQA